MKVVYAFVAMVLALTAASMPTTTVINATGDLNISQGPGTLYFYFDVPSTITSVQSARVSICAGDVDSPQERDKVYFNGKILGQLQGGDNEFEVNTFVVPSASVKIGRSNTMRIEVDESGQGWRVVIKYVKLILNGEGGAIELSASSGLRDCVNLSWDVNFSGTTYNVYRGISPETLNLYREGLSERHFTDTAVASGVTYYYQVMSKNGISSDVVDGRCQDGSITLWPTTSYYHEIRLTWNPDNCEGPYTIYRGSRVDDLAPLAYDVVDMSYTDTKVTGGETYYYRVVAANGIVSDVVKGASKRAEIKLTVSSNRYDVVRLDWTCPVDGLKYRVFKSDRESGPFYIAYPSEYKPMAKMRYYNDPDVQQGAVCYYYVESEHGVRSDVKCGRRTFKEVPPNFSFDLEGSDYPQARGSIGLNNEKDVLVAGHRFVCNVNMRHLNPFCSVKWLKLVGRPKNGLKDQHEHRIVCKVDTPTLWVNLKNVWWKGYQEASLTYAGSDKIVFSAILDQGCGYHGEYEWTLTCYYSYDNENDPKDVSLSGLMKPVYFDRDGKDDKNPNWFTYWKADGACPGLQDKRVVYRGKTVKGLRCGGAWSPSQGKIYIDGNAHQGFVFDKNGIRFGHRKDGKPIYGIYSVENVVAHESQHAATRARYEQMLKVLPPQPNPDSDRIVGGCGLDAQAVCGKCSEITDKKHELCDWIVDKDEEDGVITENGVVVNGLEKNNLDTFGVYLKHLSYASYGDDEYVSLCAGLEGAKRAIFKNDWAYPGEQSGGLPYGDSAKSNARRVLSTPTSGTELKATNEGIDNAADLHIVVSHVSVDVVQERETVKAFEYQLDLEINGAVPVLFEGNLVDANNDVVATATAIADKDDPTVILLFDAKEIHRNGGVGPYTLGDVNVYSGNDDPDNKIATLSEFYIGACEVPREKLDCQKAYILRAEEHEKTENALRMTLFSEINKGQTYALFAELSDTNGNCVAVCRRECMMEEGMNEVALEFPGTEIYASAHDGPYVLSNVQLWQGDEMVDASVDMLMTEVAYSYKEFKPANATVTADCENATFSVSAKQDDGLFSALKFSFDVNNASEDTLCYRFSATLVGTNSTSVMTRSGQYANLTPGTNHLEVDFPASEIFSKGVNGPYSVWSVEMLAQDAAGNSFVFSPHVQSPAYKATDFAVASVAFSGETARVERADDSLVVAFDYETTRGCSVVAAATLVDTNGNFVARAYSTNTVRRAGNWTAELEFSWRDLAKENVGGPYRVAYFSLTPQGAGEESVVSDSLEIRDVNWLTLVAQQPIEVPEGVDWDSLFSWGVSAGGAVAVSYLGTNAHDVVVVPSEHDGLPVTQIAGNCFKSNLTVKAVVVSDGVVDIGNSAFAYCEALQTVSLPETLERIGRYAFAQCWALEQVRLPDSLREIDVGAFSTAVSLEALWLPVGVMNIPDQMCSQCSSLVMVAFPPVATNMGTAAFQNCRKLTEIVVPSGVASIGDRAFTWCTGITNFIFRGPPPTVGVAPFPQGVRARYPLEYQADWEAEIVDGLWNGLRMYAETLPRKRIDTNVIADEAVFDGEEWTFGWDGTRADQSLRNARIGDGQQTSMTATLNGAGVVAFDWRTSCEGLTGGGAMRDHAEFLVDGVVVSVRAGDSLWSRFSIELEGDGEHTVTWRYVKDGSGSAGEDCVWISDIQFAALADEETSAELLDESEYNWFYEDVPVKVEKERPLEYVPDSTPEESTCQVDYYAEIGEVDLSTLSAMDVEDMQAAIVRVSNAVGLEYAVLTDKGWTMVGNGSIEPGDGERVKASIVVDYSSTPSTVKYMISGHTLTNAEGVASFVCAKQRPAALGIGAKGEGKTDVLAGKYQVANSDLQEVAQGMEAELSASLDTFSNETFQVSGGGTLVIPADKVPAGGVNRKLHVDGNSAVKFDLSGMDAIPSVMKLFNGVGNSFAVGKNMKLVVPGEGVDRVSKLFVKNGDLEARVAERPTLGADESGVAPFCVNTVGGSTTAEASVANAVEGFWYGLLSADLLTSGLLLDPDSVKQCTHTGALKLESTANADSDSGFYRVSVSAEKP